MSLGQRGDSDETVPESANVRHVIVLKPINNRIRQVVSIEPQEKTRGGTRLTLDVRSQIVDWPGVCTRLPDGRALSEMDGELTVHAAESLESEGPETACGTMVYAGRGPAEYFVLLRLPADQFSRVLELARSCSLSAIEIGIDTAMAREHAGSIADNAPGIHSRRLLRDGYHVWDPKHALAIQAVHFDFELDRPADFHARAPKATPGNEPRVKDIVARAHRTLARIVLNYPQGEWVGDGVQFPWQGRQDESPTGEQIKTIAGSFAGTQIGSLVATAYSQAGSPAAHAAASCAVKFIKATGVIYRARARQIASRKYAKKPESGPVVFPSHLPLWLPPSLDGDVFGGDSLEGLDRESLLEVCGEFYQSGIRCPWFEKMLVEALVGAEAYGTLKASKTNPSLWTGRAQFIQAMIMSWAFSRSKGGSMYLLYLTAGNLVLWAIKIAIFAVIAWNVYSRYDRTHDWQSTIGVIVIGLVAIGWVGRYLTRLIVRWSRPSPMRAGVEVLSTPFGKALTALLETYKMVTADTASTSAARQGLLSAMHDGAVIDQIALAYLDRAIEAKEFIWTRAGLSREYYELDDEVDEVPVGT